MAHIAFATILIVESLLSLGLSIPLYREKIKMNHSYGIMLGKSFESEENWYKINKYGAKRLMFWSIPLFVLGVITIFLPPLNEYLKFIFSFTPFIVLIAAIETNRYSKRL